MQHQKKEEGVQLTRLVFDKNLKVCVVLHIGARVVYHRNHATHLLEKWQNNAEKLIRESSPLPSLHELCLNSFYQVRDISV